MNAVGELKKWTVALVAEGRKGASAYEFSPFISVDSLPARGDTGVSGRYTIGVLTDPIDEAIDMDEAEWCSALAATKLSGNPMPPEIGAKNRLGRADARYANSAERDAREDHPPRAMAFAVVSAITCSEEKQVIHGWNEPIMGIAVSFPASDSGVKVNYKVGSPVVEGVGG